MNFLRELMSMLAISCVANGNKKCYANKHNHNILYIKLKGTDIEYCNCCIKKIVVTYQKIVEQN